MPDKFPFPSIQLNPHEAVFYQNPYPTYQEWRTTHPIFYWENFGFWCFSTYEDVNAGLRDRRFGRQILHLASREELGWPPERADLKPFLDVDRYTMLELEPPAHTRLRGLVQKAFTARQVERLRPRITSLCHQLIDRMEGRGSCDLLEAYATPLPVRVIGELLGVPLEMSGNLLSWSHAMVGMYELGRTVEQEQKAVQAAQEFVAFLKDFLKVRREQPQDDLISHLLQVEEAGEQLNEAELISTCIMLLNAGHEATVHGFGNSVYALLQNPEQLARLRSQPELITSAVEELLRYDSPLHLFNRWVLEDLDYKGHHFQRGTQIALLLGSANRDAAQFTDPDRLDLRRSPNPHLAFGGGIHYCLGAPLARLELQIALAVLFERLPGLRLESQPQYRDSYHFHGLSALQVRWR